jgi:hypothetical protein
MGLVTSAPLLPPVTTARSAVDDDPPPPLLLIAPVSERKMGQHRSATHFEESVTKRAIDADLLAVAYASSAATVNGPPSGRRRTRTSHPAPVESSWPAINCARNSSNAS